MSQTRSERISALEEWKAGVMTFALVSSIFPILIGSHMVAHHYLSIPWVPADSEGALIGIPLALTLYVLVPHLLEFPVADVFIDPPDGTTLFWFGWGLLLTSALALGAIVTLPGELTTGNIALRPVLQALVGAVLLALLAATTEELVFRGYLLSIIGHKMEWIESIVLTSISFGLLHNAKIEGTGGSELYVMITMIAGLLYALVTYYTGSVWPAVMLHAAWNTMFHPDILEFGPASGVSDSAIFVFQYTDSTPLFGGDFAEVTGSPFVALLLLGSSVLVVSYYEFRRTPEYSLT